jgi:hypothetical protein
MIKNPNDFDANPFRSVAEQFERSKKAQRERRDESVVEQIARSLRQRQERAEFFNTTRETIEHAVTPLFLDIHGKPVSAVARQILEAGMKRRGENVPPTFSDDAHGRKAKAIVNAGRRARGEEEIK